MATTKDDEYTVKDTLKFNGEQAVLRTATRKLVVTVRKSAHALLKNRVDAPTAKKIVAFLNTKDGEAFIAGALGLIQLIMPQLTGDKFTMLGDELRTQSIQHVTDSLADGFLDPLIDAFVMVAKGLPEAADA